MTLYIKNMVCNRCILVVRTELEQLGITPQAVRLGEADIDGELSPETKRQLQERLLQLGFELLEDRTSRIVEAVKNTVVEAVYAPQSIPDINFSDFLAARLGLEYKYISTLFSQTQGRTIEKYVIAQKIERVKELLVYDELTLSEIAFRLGYSSVAHLSAQFKHTTGLTPSYYKRAGGKKRKPLDKL